MDHEELRSLIPAYSMGAIPEDEIGRIRDHILSCDECMAEADSYADVTSSLALAVEPVPLPAGFHERVIEAVRVPGVPAEEIRIVRPPWWRRLNPAALAGVVAAFVVLVASIAGLVGARNELDRDRRVITALVHEQGLELRGDAGIGKIVPSRDGSLFVATGLRDAPAGHTYQLWVMRGGNCPASDCEIESAGTFTIEDGLVIHPFDESISEWDEGAVTIEQEGGAESPTTDPIISSLG